MPPHDPAASHETPQGPVEIRQDAAITIPEALLIATEQNFPLGKSTLQRWAKAWGEQGAISSVKCVLVTTRAGVAYRIDREDFQSWLFEQKQNLGPGETFRDPVMSHETRKDTSRSQQTSQDPKRPHEAPRDDTEIVGPLRDEIMNLKIDVEVRKQLLTQAAGEINRQRDQIETLLRENGGLETQILQLSASGANMKSLSIGRDTGERGSDDPQPYVDSHQASENSTL